MNLSAGFDLIHEVAPDLLVVGDDWLGKDYLAQINVTPEWLHNRGIGLMYLPRTDKISSSERRERLP